jgi:hypothetical protein
VKGQRLRERSDSILKAALDEEETKAGWGSFGGAQHGARGEVIDGISPQSPARTPIPGKKTAEARSG